MNAGIGDWPVTGEWLQALPENMSLMRPAGFSRVSS
jgi:hypothetical protein